MKPYKVILTLSVPPSPRHNLMPCSQMKLRQVALEIHGLRFFDMGSFIPDHGNARMAIEIVVFILTSMIDQQIFLFCDQRQNLLLARLKMRGQLDSKSWTRLLTKAAVNEPCKINTEPAR